VSNFRILHAAGGDGTLYAVALSLTPETSRERQIHNAYGTSRLECPLLTNRSCWAIIAPDLSSQLANAKGRYRQHRSQSRGPTLLKLHRPLSGTPLRFGDYTTEWIPGPMGVYRYESPKTQQTSVLLRRNLSDCQRQTSQKQT